MINSLAEQAICVKCGMCCDGTIFATAKLNKGEKENLPPEIAQNYQNIDGHESFRLPCPAFKGKCTIYNKQKADICGRFRCDVLKDFSDHRISLDQAFGYVGKAMSLKSNIKTLLLDIEGIDKNTPFSGINQSIDHLRSQLDDKKRFNQNHRELLVKIHSLQTLISTKFRRKANFRSRVIKFFRIPLSEKKLFIEALLILYTSKLILSFVSLKFCSRLITKTKYPDKKWADESLIPVKTAISQANRLTFRKSSTLDQSFAAKWMLQRRKISSTLTMGVKVGTNKNLSNYSWLKVGEFEIVDKKEDCTEIYTL